MGDPKAQQEAFTREQMAEQLRRKIRLLGTCGCKDRCREEGGGFGEKPHRLGVFELKAKDVGALPEDWE